MLEGWMFGIGGRKIGGKLREAVSGIGIGIRRDINGKDCRIVSDLSRIRASR